MQEVGDSECIFTSFKTNLHFIWPHFLVLRLWGDGSHDKTLRILNFLVQVQEVIFIPEQFTLCPYAKKCKVIHHVILIIEQNVSVLAHYIAFTSLIQIPLSLSE